MKTQIFMKKGEMKMKEQRLYVCEMCGTKYNEKECALDCEKAHMRPVGFAESFYPCRDERGGLRSLLLGDQLFDGDDIGCAIQKGQLFVLRRLQPMLAGQIRGRLRRNRRQAQRANKRRRKDHLSESSHHEKPPFRRIAAA